MAWIESHQSLLTHRKLLRLSALLKTDKYKLIGHLQALWWWALDNADHEGNLELILDDEIAGAAGWPQRRGGEFVSALVRAGFIETHNEGATYRLHNWWRYAGKLNDSKKAASVQGSFGNHRRWHVERNIVVPDCDFCVSLSESGGDIAKRIAPTSPHLTNQPTLIDLKGAKTDDGQARRSWLYYELELLPEEARELTSQFPGLNITSLHNEWRNWILEEEEKRRPKEKIAAFVGFLKRKAKKPGA